MLVNLTQKGGPSLGSLTNRRITLTTGSLPTRNGSVCRQSHFESTFGSRETDEGDGVG